MPKKTKRQAARKMPTYASQRSSQAEFNPDYTPIKRDLRRIGILAGSFFVILVVLSFFLR